MWIMLPPSSTIRRASAAYSSGVYGIAAHCSRLATAPEMAQVRMTGSSRLNGSPSEVGRVTSPWGEWGGRAQPLGFFRVSRMLPTSERTVHDRRHHPRHLRRLRRPAPD